jgi:lysophospholipase L1-like esterase
VTPTGGSRASGGADAGGATGTGGDGGAAGNTRAGGATGTGGATSTGGATGTGGVRATGGRTGAGGSTHSGTWRIMPLGDSITVTTCYPQFLFKQLADAGKTNFVFVGGNQCNQICGSGIPNTVCEGQGGMWATHLMSGGASASLLPQWCNADQADVALMHFGTNDIWGTQPTQKILDAFSEIVDALRAAVPGVVVFVAQIIPMNPTNCTSCETRLEELNAAIPAWATGKSTAASPIYPVDLWSSLPVATYLPNTTLTDDGVHPKPSAAQLMADAWYQALSSRGMP